MTQDIVAEIASTPVTGNKPGDFGQGKSHMTKAEFDAYMAQRKDVMVDTPPPRLVPGMDMLRYTALELAIQSLTADGRVADCDDVMAYADKFEDYLRDGSKQDDGALAEVA